MKTINFTKQQMQCLILLIRYHIPAEEENDYLFVDGNVVKISDNSRMTAQEFINKHITKLVYDRQAEHA